MVNKHFGMRLGGQAILLAMVVGVSLLWSYPPRFSGPQTASLIGIDNIDLLRAEPIVFEPHVPPGFSVDEGDLAKILSQVEPLPRGMSASLSLHVLAAHGLEARFKHKQLVSSDALLRLFTNDEFARAYFGQPVFVRSRYGLRPAMFDSYGPTKETHYDQTVGSLAQLGVSLDLPISIEGERFSLRDVMSDSIACFEPGQAEIEWTVMAYAAYLAPHRQWQNKFRERYSFDQLTDKLLAREFDRASCCGTHIVDAMIMLSRVDQEVAPLLSPEVRDRLTQRLEQIVNLAIARQQPDGSWAADWYSELEEIRSPKNNHELAWPLVATSHLAHCLMFLPEEQRVSPDVLHRAGKWIHRRLRGADDKFVEDNFCPCSHGAWILRELHESEMRAIETRSDT